MNDLEISNNTTFESIKHIDNEGKEYWYARELTANETHYNVGKEVRDTIKRLGGTMPEELPTPEKSIKVLEKESKKKLTNKTIVKQGKLIQ